MKLIDADLLEADGWRMERIRRYDQYCMEWQTKKPTEFDEAIVRCEDCQFYRFRSCSRFGIRITRKADDFCSEGVRKDAEKTSLPL